MKISGEWSSQFQPNDTKMDNFYVKRDVIRATKFMKQEGQFNYYPSEELRAHVLQVIFSLKMNTMSQYFYEPIRLFIIIVLRKDNLRSNTFFDYL